MPNRSRIYTKLTAGDAAENDRFGESVAISGNTAMVGAPTDGDEGADSGSVYVFERSGSSWSQQAKPTAGAAAAGDFFWSFRGYQRETRAGGG